MNMKTGKSSLFIAIFIAIVSISGCEKNKVTKTNFLLFPAGRSFIGSSEIKAYVAGSEINPDFIFDSCGGYWIRISRTDLPGSGQICIQYTRRREELALFHEISAVTHNWIASSFYIDCDNEEIQSKALELTNGYQSNIDKARRIQQFVISHLDFNIYHDSFLEKASRTYELGYGTCMNFSRLFIALCRAANIPARSVWGIVYGYNDDNIYDYHHQWAEILDEEGYWHPADLTYTTSFDLNDIRYLDLVYAAEENTIVKNRSSEEVILGDVSYFNDYPATLSGRLGFELIEDERPEYMILEFTYEL